MESQSHVALKQRETFKHGPDAYYEFPSSSQYCVYDGENYQQSLSSCPRPNSLQAGSHLQRYVLPSNSPTPDSAHRFPSPYATTSHSRTVVHCQSSTFCTELHLSSSTSSPTCKEFANLPFLPHPSKAKPHVSSHTSSSTCISSPTLQKLGSESDILIENSSESQGHAGQASSGILHGVNFENNPALNEQFEFQMFAEDLDMAILDNGENPGIDVSIKSRSTYIK